MKLSIINYVKKTLPRVRLQRKNIFQKNRLSLQYFRKCSESADVSIPKVVLALSSLALAHNDPKKNTLEIFEKNILEEYWFLAENSKLLEVLICQDFGSNPHIFGPTHMCA